MQINNVVETHCSAVEQVTHATAISVPAATATFENAHVEERSNNHSIGQGTKTRCIQNGQIGRDSQIGFLHHLQFRSPLPAVSVAEEFFVICLKLGQAATLAKRTCVTTRAIVLF